MRYFLAVLLAFAWALWFGGLITLFLLVTTLFKTFSGDLKTFGMAGSAVFHQFERYQLILGAVALLASMLAVIRARSRANMAILVLFVLCTAAAVLSTAYLTPRLEDLRLAGQTASDQFKHLHIWSRLISTAVCALLLPIGFLLPLEIREGKRG